MIEMDAWTTIRYLAAQGKGKKAIARELGVSRNTVRRALAREGPHANGTGLRQLTTAPGADQAPAWSPDGTKLAFSSERDNNTEVYMMNADGSGQSRLTNNPARDAAPAWSPDGTRIAFESDRDKTGDGLPDDYEIYVMDADGSNPVNITSNPAWDAMPDWWAP